MGLFPIMNQVKELIATFEFIFLTHIYKKFNTHVDYLSKETLTLQEGTLVVHEYKETLPFQDCKRVCINGFLGILGWIDITIRLLC